MKKALLFFADGAEEVEALTPVDILRRAAVNVTVVGVLGKTQTGSHGISVNTDISAQELGTDGDFDMIILPGGIKGTQNLDNSEIVDKYIRRAEKENKFIAAICAAPTILGKRGLLTGKNATCYPSMQDEISACCTKVGGRVVRDGNIITGVGAGASVEFALALAAALTDEETSEKIKKGIVAG